MCPDMPPPTDFDLGRGKCRGWGGETKDELLARAAQERAARADERRRKHCALLVQRVWRGRRVAALARTATLAAWDAKYGNSRETPSVNELFDTLLPPLHLVGVRRAGATRTLRVLALALGTCPAMCAVEARQRVTHWNARARRLSSFALGALALELPSDEQEAIQQNAIRECAARLLTALHHDGVLLNLNDPKGLAHHAKLCDCAASLARENDPYTTMMIRIAVGTSATAVEYASVHTQLTETPSDCPPLGLVHVACRVFGTVPNIHKVCGSDLNIFASVLSDGNLRDFIKAFKETQSTIGGSGVDSAALPFDPVTAGDTLLWLLTGWHFDLQTKNKFAQPGRRKLSSLSNETVVQLLDFLTWLIDQEGRSRDAQEKNATQRHIAVLREVWFVMGVFREGNDSVMDALARLFWTASFTYSSTRSSHRRVLGALAFAPGVVQNMWHRLAVRLPVAVSISEATGSDDGKKTSSVTTSPGAGGFGLWTSPALATGVESVSTNAVPLFGIFALAYSHLLEVLDDAEFFSTQKPFTLNEQRAIAACANTVVVRERLRRRSSGVGSSTAARLTSAVVSLLKGLVTRDARRSFTPLGMWLAPADAAQIDKQRVGGVISKPLPPEAAAAALMIMESSGDASTSGGCSEFLRDCFHALPFDERVKIFRLLVRNDRRKLQIGAQSGGVDADRETQGQRVVPVAKIRIRRNSVLEDALTGILPLGDTAKGRLAVKFINIAGEHEAGIDAGGLFKELLAVTLAEALDPRRGLFLSSSETGGHTNNIGNSGHSSSGHNNTFSHTSYPNPLAGDLLETKLLLQLTGVLMGKALYEGVLVSEFKLADFFVKKLLGESLSLDDLPSLDFETHKALVQVLEYAREPNNDVADLCLDWFVREEAYGQVVAQNLRPHEKSKDDVVESHDVLSYVLAVAEHKLIKRRVNCDSAFFQGIHTIIDPKWLKLFNSKELIKLTCGDLNGDINVENLKSHTILAGGYEPTSKTIKMFWQVVSGFSADERKQLLRFVTSSSSPPVLGFQHLHPPFTVYKVKCDASSGAGGVFGSTMITLGFAKGVERLPTASTCFNTLKLPNFKRIKTMREKLLMAISSGAGFELS